MKKILALAISGLLLVACDDDNPVSTTMNNPTLSDISGIWDGTETIDNETDIVYFVIKDYGEIITYDYDGDSFDQGDDCYYKDVESINDFGNGSFEVIDSYNDSFTFNISLSGDQLTWKFPAGDFHLIKSSLKESDFSPLCDDISQVTTITPNSGAIKQSRIVRGLNR